MPRRPRTFIPNHPVHLVQRGHNQSQVFQGPKDAKSYLGWLEEASIRHGTMIHAYVLMPNHIHLVLTPKSESSLPEMMRHVNWRYSRYVNAEHQRSGSLWDGRYKACIIDPKNYFFSCCQYVELNPVRVGMTEDPSTYRWSSFKVNALGIDSALLTPHPLYLTLGDSREKRAAAYREIVSSDLTETTIEAIRSATLGGWALGDKSFEERVTRRAGQNMAPRGPGRPWPKKP